ncbi:MULTISPECIES: chromate efflux transporter [unclassified Pseudoxanthomonas]|uniref:chromate efflux transporter n=1 Tax=unclassified Pseudoxanthomonas TaxID=2645906 RepID=UPI0030788540
METGTETATEQARGNLRGVFLVFLRLGLTSFGGPIAHLGYFRDEFVVRRRWLSEGEYAELIALCQFLPGPASSQVGMAIGIKRAGLRGALAAWCGFTLPSALLMILFALGLMRWGQALPADALHGMKLVAVAVVAQAVWGMARMFCRDPVHLTLALASALLMIVWPQALMQVGVILLGASVGLLLRRSSPAIGETGLAIALPRRYGAPALSIFFALLLSLPLVAAWSGDESLLIFDAFYRAGSLVFGGGHVVLPLLQAEVVVPGWMSASDFLAGYGAAQAVPGPLFTFSAFLGAAMDVGPGGWLGGMGCLFAIFLPSFLLVVGVLPFWVQVRRHALIQSALAGVNGAVVGLLLAALYDPLWTSSVRDWRDVALVLAAVAALMWAKLPPWLVVLALGFGGFAMAVFAI